MKLVEIQKREASDVQSSATQLVSLQPEQSSSSVELRLLQQKTGATTLATADAISTLGDDIKVKLLEFCFKPRIPISTPEFNILQYWHVQRFESPEIFQLAQVALAVPQTQVEVERMFSALVLVLSHLRNRLSRDTLNALMMLKMNLNMIDSVDFSSFK